MTKSRFFAGAWFWLVVAVGAFLAASAIVSLPRLREVDKPSSDVSANALGQSLEALKLSAEQLNRYYTEELNTDPLDIDTPASASGDAGAAVAAAPASTQTPDASAPYPVNVGSPSSAPRQATIRDANEFVLDFHARWKDLVKGSQQLRDAVVDNEDQATKNAVSSFHLRNIEHQGSREEREQFLAIQTWFTTVVTAGKEQVRICTGELARSRPDFQSWALLARLARSAAMANEFDATQVERLHHELIDRTTWLVNKVPSLKSACFIPKWPDAPGPVPLGQSLGPMRFIGAWLLNADSLPLALIVGMVGLGLLGSVISTFLSLPAAMRTSEGGVAMEKLDFSRMVLRGLSAALIVFLAAQGGLAVLSSGDGVANPYIVLLACFVSAVFSETVWQWTYQWLKTSFPSGKTGQGNGSGAEQVASADAVEATPTQKQSEMPGKK
jgi:hypothetical protein